MIPQAIHTPNPEYLLSENFLVLDFETTNLDYGSALNPDNRLLLSVWEYQGKVKTLWGSEYEISDLLSDIDKADILVAQNAKFELQWLSRAGLDLTKVLIYDTMIGEYVLTSNKLTKTGARIRLDLGSISRRYGLGSKDVYIDKCMNGGICPSELPRSLVERRCIKDVYQTKGIFLEQRQELLRTSKLAAAYTRMIFTPVLADIEFNGMDLDADKVQEEYSKQVEIASKLKSQLDAMTGGINPKSPPQVAEYLYGTLGFKELRDRSGKVIRGKPNKRFPDGQPKTDEPTIQLLKASNKKQRQFLELKKAYSKATHALSSYLEFFLGVCREKGGRFYAQFNQTITRTQRLSSSGRAIKFDLFPKPKRVQFQNFPRAYKYLFTAHEDNYLFCEPDGAQLEFRVAGHLGRDTKVIQDLIDEVDVHTYTANTITEAGQPTDRQGAKAHTFKPLYGGSSGTKAEQAYYEAFKKKYCGVAATQDVWKMEVVNSGSLVTETGLEFFWPDTKINSKGYINNQEAICNYPVQSLATADIIPIAVTKLWHELKARGMRSKIVNTIHDSSPSKVHVDEQEEFKELVIDSYTSYVYFYLKEVYGIDFLAPLGVGIKMGTHWGEGKEEKFQVNPLTKLDGVNYL